MFGWLIVGRWSTIVHRCCENAYGMHHGEHWYEGWKYCCNGYSHESIAMCYHNRENISLWFVIVVKPCRCHIILYLHYIMSFHYDYP